MISKQNIDLFAEKDIDLDTTRTIEWVLTQEAIYQ